MEADVNDNKDIIIVKTQSCKKRKKRKKKNLEKLTNKSI